MTAFDYLQTRNEIIYGALRIVGALEADQNPSAEMLDQGIKALELLVKSWGNEHLFLWSYNLTSASTVAGDETVIAEFSSTAVVGLDKAWVVDGTSEIPLEVISYSAYTEITDKTASGRPSAIAFKPLPIPIAYLWPEPDAIYDINLLVIYPLEDFDTAGGSGDIKVRFQRALKYALAEDLLDEYPGPMNERQYIQNKAASLFAKAKRSDVAVETTNEVAGMYGRCR